MKEQLASLLQQLEQQMKADNLWTKTKPSTEALNSQQPFAFDTLPFEKWLQFIFIEKFSYLNNNHLPIPTQFQISPMAEQVFHSKYIKLQQLLIDIEHLCHSSSHHNA